MPLKGESPVKTSDHRLIRLHVKLEGVPVNGVDHRAHDRTGILTNPKHNVWPTTCRKRGEGKKYETLYILGIAFSFDLFSVCTKRSFFEFRFSERSYSYSNLINPPFQQRLNPSRYALTVAIKECQYVTRSIGGTNESCPDQTLPFVGADEPHTFQITDVVS